MFYDNRNKTFSHINMTRHDKPARLTLTLANFLTYKMYVYHNFYFITVANLANSSTKSDSTTIQYVPQLRLNCSFSHLINTLIYNCLHKVCNLNHQFKHHTHIQHYKCKKYIPSFFKCGKLMEPDKESSSRRPSQAEITGQSTLV